MRSADGDWNADHGVWFYQLELPRSADGKRRRLRRLPGGPVNSRDAALAEYTYARDLLAAAGTDRKLRDRLSDALSSARSGESLQDVAARIPGLPRRLRPGGPLLLGEYLQRWITARQMDDNTRNGYEGHIRNYLVPYLGHVPVVSLTAADVEDMFGRVLDRDHKVLQSRGSADAAERERVKGHRVASPATLLRVKATLRKALNDAIRKHRLLDHNPASFAELPTPVMPKARIWTPPRVSRWQETGQLESPVMVWTPQQARQFLDYTRVHDPDLHPVFRLMLLAGPRRGEALGIRADQIDFGQRVAVFTHQITTVKYQMIYKPVKSRSGDRIVALDSETLECLADYLRSRGLQHEQLGDAWPRRVQLASALPGGGCVPVDVDVLFRRPDGRAWHPNAVSDRFAVMSAATGLPPVRVHDLRHGAATYAGAVGGSLLDIKERLGLSTIAIAGDIYASLLQNTERELAERVSALVSCDGRTRAANAGARDAATCTPDARCGLAVN